MLKYITCLLVGLSCIGFSAMAQLRPSGFSYQTLITTANGPLINTKVTLVATLHTPANTPVWREVLNTRTDANGAASIALGVKNSLPSGVPLFSNVDFSSSHLALKVEVTSPVSMVISDEPLQTVPYARYAKNAPTKLPAGLIVAFGGDSTKIPAGWRHCNGQLLTRDGVDPASGIPYSRLFDAIGTAWGSDNANTFRLPDLRGLFLRGVDPTSATDVEANMRRRLYPGGNSGNRVGSYQQDTVGSHRHTANVHVQNLNLSTSGQNTLLNRASTGNEVKTSSFDGLGPETRPKNAYVFYIIKL